MSAPGTPTNFYVQTANGVNLISWSLSAGATSYVIQRSLDNVTYTNLVTINGSPLATSYLDSAVTLGTTYWYQVAALIGSNSSPYTSPQSIVPAPQGEYSLGAIRLASQQTADRVNSNFVTVPEWNSFINLAMYELYDLLITVYEDYFMAPPIQFNTDGATYLYPLPNGSNTFLNALNLSQTVTPPAIYKLLGVDLQAQNSNNGYVSLPKFTFEARNQFFYPNTASTLYGPFNLRYRWMGQYLELIPTPSANQGLRLWYIPRLTELLADTDTSSISISGWMRYVIVRAAKYALDKEESDTTKLDSELLFLKTRIEESAANKDAGQPDRISDTRSANGHWGGFGSGGPGWPNGGYALAPVGLAYNFTNHALTNSIAHSQSLLGYVFCLIAASYFVYSNRSYLSGRVRFSGTRNFCSSCLSSFSNHVVSIFFGSSEE